MSLKAGPVNRLPTISTREFLAALRKAGFVELPGRGKGSHHVLYRNDPATILTVPERKTIIGNIAGNLATSRAERR